MIRTACVHCGRAYQVAEHLLGKRTRCRGCSQTFTLTAAGDRVKVRPRPAEEDEAPWGMEIPLAEQQAAVEAPRYVTSGVRVRPAASGSRPGRSQASGARTATPLQRISALIESIRVLGPVDWTFWFFAVFLVIGIVAAQEREVGAAQLLVILAGLFLVMVGKVWSAHRAVRNGFNTLQALIPLGGLLFMLQNWHLMKRPAWCAIRGALLLAVLLVPLTLDRAKDIARTRRSMIARETVEPRRGDFAGGGTADTPVSVARNESPRTPTMPARTLSKPIDPLVNRSPTVVVKPTVAVAPRPAVDAHDDAPSAATTTGSKFLPDAAIEPDLGGEEELFDRYALKTPQNMRRTENRDARSVKWVSRSDGRMQLTASLSRLPGSAGGKPNVVTVMPKGRRLEVPSPALVVIGGHREDGTIGTVDFVRVTRAGEATYAAVDADFYLVFECRATDSRSMALLEAAVRTLRWR